MVVRRRASGRTVPSCRAQRVGLASRCHLDNSREFCEMSYGVALPGGRLVGPGEHRRIRGGPFRPPPVPRLARPPGEPWRPCLRRAKIRVWCDGPSVSMAAARDGHISVLHAVPWPWMVATRSDRSTGQSHRMAAIRRQPAQPRTGVTRITNGDSAGLNGQDRSRPAVASRSAAVG